MKPKMKKTPQLNEYIQVVSYSIVTFGELWEMSLRDLLYASMAQATDRAIQNKHIGTQSEIEAVYVANMAAGSFSDQRHLSALASQFFEHHPPAFRLEAACASGGAAMLAATDSLRAKRYKTVLVVGVEKMTDVSPNVATQVLATAADMQNEYGSTFPGLYALFAQAHAEKYGTTREQLSAVAVKNHLYAVDNMYAQYRKKISFEQVEQSALVADPLRLLDCSPITDGAAAVVLQRVSRGEKCAGEADKTATDLVNKTATGLVNKKATVQPNKKAVFITGQGHAQDTLDIASRSDLTQLKATVNAGKQAYTQAGISAQEIEVAEVHDCFTIAEILASEDLGFFEKGAAGPAVVAAAKQLLKGNKSNRENRENMENRANRENRESTEKNESHKPVINLSGGLKACGHPVGATGVKQIAYIAQLLESGKFKTGLTHNVGGSGATAIVHILQTDLNN
jgi:acetyl-CoA C-acetyltransferase